MGQQRTEATESLLVSQGHDNLVDSEENGGVGLGDGGSVAASTVTTILALSTFEAACLAFGLGCSVGAFLLNVFNSVSRTPPMLNLFSALQLGYSSPTQSSIMADLGLSVAEFSLFGSILSIGAILGAAISGKIADLLGRKLTMWILNVFYISGWLAIAFTKVPWLLDLGRLSLGFTYGISIYLAPIYIGEITPKNLRGRFTAMVPLMACWGMSFMYVVGSFVDWRDLALIAAIPGLIQLPLLFFIPESPRWLAKVGRDKDLEAVLLCLRGEEADISDEATDIKDHVESLKSFSKEGIFDIFQKKYIRPLLIVVGLMALSSLGGTNAFVYYSSVIFVSAGISSMVGLVTLAVAQTLLGILGTILIDKSGRRPLLLVASAGLCLSCFLTGLSFLLKEHNWWDQGSPILALIGLMMYMGSYVVASGIPWLLLSELFPINVKGSAGSICNFISNITGWAVAYYFNFLIEWSSAGIFFIFSAFCLANFILAATMVPETKGRTLEEIQSSITHSSE
ncbi:sugar transporter ERD6-like 15 [Durio zibethinus]|uniref:Sugar transporter ERD6-like 15 n=1 Tax=Durio zibethinus TaxID=66656 RepID=A0A6P5YT57_DURZI|nr:sugar transporter ERD6-like 15 [Durio zibethinus]